MRPLSLCFGQPAAAGPIVVQGHAGGRRNVSPSGWVNPREEQIGGWRWHGTVDSYPVVVSETLKACPTLRGHGDCRHAVSPGGDH
ncbi:hypothetical protein J4732_13530 [Serratia marcescens]|uniref:Uncharacterized protein n=1 Tax=Serratia marcescens TaxID=615 RepID=A0A939NQJ3_SERMA|nr:hypothetical protein [Serratia marcescens]